MPNRSLVGDAAYIASVVRQIDGPVLLVGHSYGGAVITVAGTEENVVGLVYLAGYALDEGESLGELQGALPRLTDWPGHLVYTPFPVDGSDEPGTDVSVDIAELPRDLRRRRGPTTSPACSPSPSARWPAVAFGEPAGRAAWKTKPAWGIVASSDHAINPDVERFGYERAQMKVTEIDSSHLVMLAHPKEVVGVIREALASVTT